MSHLVIALKRKLQYDLQCAREMLSKTRKLCIPKLYNYEHDIYNHQITYQRNYNVNKELLENRKILERIQ